jgi:hypothetical protein
MTEGPERRLHPRVPCDIEATVARAVVRASDEDGAVEGRAVDISLTGLAMVASAPIAQGTAVRVDLRAVLEGAISEPLSVSGTVVWAAAVRHGTQLGVRFDATLPPATRTKLALLLQLAAGELDVGGPSGG